MKIFFFLNTFDIRMCDRTSVSLPNFSVEKPKKRRKSSGGKTWSRRMCIYMCVCNRVSLVECTIGAVEFTNFIFDLGCERIGHILEVCVMRLHIFHHDGLAKTYEIMNFGRCLVKHSRRCTASRMIW